MRGSTLGVRIWTFWYPYFNSLRKIILVAMFFFWKVYYNRLAFHLRTAFTVMTMSRAKYAVKARTVEKYFLAWATFEFRKLFPQTTAWVVQSAESVTHGSASSATLALTNIDSLWETKEWREPREHDICLFCKPCRSHWGGGRPY